MSTSTTVARLQAALLKAAGDADDETVRKALEAALRQRAAAGTTKAEASAPRPKSGPAIDSLKSGARASEGLHLCETRPDVELAERAKARAEADGTSYAEAECLVLAENPKLASRYRDHRLGEAPLDELAHRAAAIRKAGGWRVSKRKAIDAALAEDPKLKEAVLAYFEPDPYKSKCTD